MSDSGQSSPRSDSDEVNEPAAPSTVPISASPSTDPTSAVDQQHPASSRIVSFLCMIGAGFCLVLGVLGFLLPVIPGTPFVLLASFLLLKGSPRLHQRLRQSRFFGRILRDWEERGGIRPRDKIRAISIVLLGACFSYIFGPRQPAIQLTALGFIIIGLWVILRLPLAKE